jgi:hypothetical protein
MLAGKIHWNGNRFDCLIRANNRFLPDEEFKGCLRAFKKRGQFIADKAGPGMSS